MKNPARFAFLGLVVGVFAQSCAADDDDKTSPPPSEGGEAGQAAGAASGSGGQLDAAGQNTGGVTDETSAGSGGAAGAPAVGGTAGVGECRAGYAECDDDWSEPCETNLANVNSCGACDVQCRNPHGSIVCQPQGCVVTSCTDGWGDCNGNPNDGCESPLIENDQHCGACGRDCTSAGATCTVDSCGDIALQQNLLLGDAGAFNERTWAFSPDVGIATMNRTGSVVQRFSLNGTDSDTIWDSGAGKSGNATLVIDGQDVLWAEAGAPNVVRTKLASAAEATTPTDLFFPEYLPVYLRQRGDYLYWISGDYGEPAYVYRRPRTAAQDEPGERIVDVPQGSAAHLAGFAVTTDAIYWVTADDLDAETVDDDIRMTSLTGGAITSVPPILGASDARIKSPGSVAVTPSLTAVDDTLYFVRFVGTSPLNGIYRFKVGDAAPTRLVRAEAVSTFAVAPPFLYYGLNAQQGVWRAPLGGGEGVKVGQNSQTAIVGVDDQFVYVAVLGQESYLYKIFQ